jgi:hypothetical protein
MTDFPDAIYTPRAVVNKSGVTYVPEKENVLFAEDINKTNDEVVAVQTALGVNPKGVFASVKAWLTACLLNLVEDTTPQLGGDLDLNGKDINQAGSDVDINVNINDGGVKRNVIKISGSEGAVSFSRQSYVLASQGSQVITSGVNTKITGFSETGDVLAEFASDKFTAKTAGIYSVIFTVKYTADVGITTIYIYKNGSALLNYNMSILAYETGFVAQTVKLNADDYVEFYVLQATGSNKTTNQCVFNITKIS